MSAMSDDEENKENKPLQCATLCDFSKHIECSNLMKPEQVLDKTLFCRECFIIGKNIYIRPLVYAEGNLLKLLESNH
jgi:hypothetical protein